MFTEEITKFQKRFDRLEEMLIIITDKILDGHMDTMKGVNAILKTFASQSEAYKESAKMFDACAKGFRQVRDACECLREELSEAAGTLVQQSYCD